MPAETLNQLLVKASGFPRTGLRFLDRRERESWASWPEIYRRASAVGSSLRALGVDTGQRVALVYPTSLEFFHAFFGILLAGAVPVPLYPPARLGRLDEYHRRTAAMLGAAGVRLVLTERRISGLLGETISSARPDLGCRTLDDLPPPEGSVEESVEASALALVQFSSGTTVDPKPVALSHRAILSQIRALNSFWPDTPGEAREKHSGVSWLPLYHDMGLIGCVFPALERPGTLTLIGPEVFVSRPAVWLRAMSRYRATISVAPNFAYGLCVDKIRDRDLEGVDLGAWRIALNGAEPVAPSVLRSFQRRFARWGFRPEALTPVYGLSEATLAVTFSSVGDEFRGEHFDREALAAEGRARLGLGGVELVSVGRPVPGTEIRIVGDGGGELPLQHVGRVEVRGPSVMDGYLGRPDLTAAAMRDGWLDTGDLGFVHDGELFLTSRQKDVVILRGRNYLPAEIEYAVQELEGVCKGCVVAVSWLPEGAPGEMLVLFAEHLRGTPRDVLEDLPAACARAVLGAVGLRPDEVVVLEPGTLPRTSSGKLRRQEALQRFLAGGLAASDKVAAFYLTGAYAPSTRAYAAE
ncbi:MAG: fatty acyl-AMP ligase [Thermoanaerobaculia bacterium]